MSGPSTPTKDLEIPATSPYGSPEPLSDDAPQPTSPATPFPTSPIQDEASPLRFAVEIIKSKPGALLEYEGFNEPSTSNAGHQEDTSAPRHSIAPFLGSSPPVNFSPIKRPFLRKDFQEKEEDTNIKEHSTGVKQLDEEEQDRDDTSKSNILPIITELVESSSPASELMAPPSSPPAASEASSATTTPNVPIAKRRRLNSSRSTTTKLMKPFKSPLKFSNTTDTAANSNNSSASFSTLTSPKRNTAPQTPIPPSKFTVEKESEETPYKTPSFSNLHKSGKKSGPSNPPFRSSFKKTTKANTASSSKDPYILSLEQKLSQLQNTLRDARQQLEEASQALKIEQSGEDTKLEELIIKWRAAAQGAADEMFTSVEQRVMRMGGVAAYNEMQKRRSGGGGGWGFSDGDPDEGLTSSQKEIKKQAMYEAGLDDVSALEKQEIEVKDTPVENDQFTMDMMLKSLNMDLDIMGYDKSSQGWVK